jgi:hypothetical protein
VSAGSNYNAVSVANTDGNGDYNINTQDDSDA